MADALQGHLFGNPVRTKHAGEPRQSTVSQATQVMLSSESNEWGTPPQIIEPARVVLGGIDLDPASSKAANQKINARQIYTIEQNGLLYSWHGRVWLNMPYGKTNGRSNQAIWLSYLENQYQVGNVEAAVALTRAAVGYRWFSWFWRRWPVCITDECLRFVRLDNDIIKHGRSKTASALWYFGPNLELFKREFGRFGRVLLPEGH